jgi:hypothetical protein
MKAKDDSTQPFRKIKNFFREVLKNKKKVINMPEEQVKDEKRNPSAHHPSAQEKCGQKGNHYLTRDEILHNYRKKRNSRNRMAGHSRNINAHQRKVA